MFVPYTLLFSITNFASGIAFIVLTTTKLYLSVSLPNVLPEIVVPSARYLQPNIAVPKGSFALFAERITLSVTTNFKGILLGSAVPVTINADLPVILAGSTSTSQFVTVKAAPLFALM